MLSYLIIGLYLLPLIWVFIYSLGQLQLTVIYWWKARNRKVNKLTLQEPQNLPFVSIQLPIYNELYVVENLLQAIKKLDYPKDKFEVQVLDDSTDETSSIIAKMVEELRADDIDIQHLQRSQRSGFKAGALAESLPLTKGDFIAIFDADFTPRPNFLLQILPYFNHQQIGLVQSRWEHSNEKYSLLTRLQAMALDAHFIIEQLSRNSAGLFMNFNGTAGVWRKECILDAGGWSSDTLTEDLDLSYRAQLKGWEFMFIPEISTPSELPVAMNAVRSQQFRWTKGAAECARKNLGKVFRAKSVSFAQKVHAGFHLLNSSLFIGILVMSIMSMPMLLLLNAEPGLIPLTSYTKVFFLSFLIVAIFFWLAFQHIKGASFLNLLKFLIQFPLFWMISMGLALHNSVAVMEGYLGKKTAFVRTPKFNFSKHQKSWRKNKYLRSKIPTMVYLETTLCVYFLAGILLAFHWGIFVLLPLHIGLFLGYGMISFLSFRHLKITDE